MRIAPDLHLAEELGRATASAGHAEMVRKTLERIGSPDELVRFIHRYTLFNGNFAGGVANLAGAFHVRQDLFRDRSEPVAACSDRSARIASSIFFAAEDEYADRGDQKRITHRDLGQSVLRHTIGYLDVDTASFDERFPLNGSTKAALDLVFDGYCVKPASRSEDGLLGGLGFHIASETSADQEFNAIDPYLRRTHPGLVAHLTAARTHLGHSVYSWFDQHTKVEVEHHEHAVQAASMALEFYSGDASPDHVRAAILAGVRLFDDTLRLLFSRILEAD